MCSNGSRHDRQRRSAVQGVGPNRENSSVRGAPHCGHRTADDGGTSVSGIGPAARGAARPGGAMPA
jgi:hypothetical protein